MPGKTQNTGLITPPDSPALKPTKLPQKKFELPKTTKNLLDQATSQILEEQKKIKNLLLKKDGEIEELTKKLKRINQERNREQEEVRAIIERLKQANTSLKNQEAISLKQETQKNQLKIDELEKELDQKKQKYQQLIEELEINLGSSDLTQIKNQLTELSNRPDISIQEWWDDYSRRKSYKQSEQEKQEWEQDKQKIKEYEKEIKELLEISDSNAWKLELTKLKNEKEGLEKKLKSIMNLNDNEVLPNDWQNQLTSQQQIKIIQYQLDQEQRKLREWTSNFPQTTPERLYQEKKEWKKPQRQLQEWSEKFPNQTAKSLEKEIKNKNTEILLLKRQITELGGTAGANPSERLIESKLREVVGVEEWDLGYLTQVLEKFLEWRDWGSSEQKRAINKHWTAIRKNLEYLKTRATKTQQIG